MSRVNGRELCGFIDASPSPFHLCETVAGRLTAAGYTELAETDRWPGGNGAQGRYFTLRAGSLVAWNSTAAAGRPFRIVGAHTDSPNLRVKQHPDRVVAGWQVIALAPYGGAWLNSWLDRDLGLSGRLSVRDAAAPGGVTHRLVRVDEPILRVPQLAIHLAEDRGALTLDPQRHVNAVWGVGERPRSLRTLIAERAGIAMIFQEFSLVPTLTVAQNIFLGNEPSRAGFLSKRELRRQFAELTENVGFALREHGALPDGTIREVVEEKLAAIHAELRNASGDDGFGKLAACANTQPLVV